MSSDTSTVPRPPVDLVALALALAARAMDACAVPVEDRYDALARLMEAFKPILLACPFIIPPEPDDCPSCDQGVCPDESHAGYRR